MLKKLWNDEAGIVTLEYLILATLLGLALIFGVHSLSLAINAELLELGNAIMALNQSYLVGGIGACDVTIGGSQAIDTPSTLEGATGIGAQIPSAIDVIVCPVP